MTGYHRQRSRWTEKFLKTPRPQRKDRALTSCPSPILELLTVRSSPVPCGRHKCNNPRHTAFHQNGAQPLTPVSPQNLCLYPFLLHFCQDMATTALRCTHLGRDSPRKSKHDHKNP